MVHHSPEAQAGRLRVIRASRFGSPLLLTLLLARAVMAAPTPLAEIQKWCAELRTPVTQLKWEIDPCMTPSGAIQWKSAGKSVEGRELVYAEFGEANAPNATLIFSAIHGDEMTPVYLGIQLARWLQEHQAEFKNTRVIIAPLVNPDGFFRFPRTRMNARGVDVNRNFATMDWPRAALQTWKSKFKSDPRRFPGDKPRSEPETIFQEAMIHMTSPQKILAIHSPLNHLDYDGPSQMSLSRFSKDYVQECTKLRSRLKAVSTGFFPGSLGNYAGQELGIPTMTLELPSSDPRKSEAYWKKFSEGIRTMIEFVVPLPDVIEPAKPPFGNKG